MSNRCLVIMTGAFQTNGGIAAVNRLVIKAIAGQEYSLDVFSLLEKDSAADQPYPLNGSKTRFRAFRGNKLLFTLAVWQAVLQNPYAYIFVDHVNLASIFLPMRWLPSVKYIIWLHGIEVFPPRPDLEGRIGLRFAWRRIASSEHTKQVVQKNHKNIEVIACDLALNIESLPDIPSLELKKETPVKLKAMDGTEQEIGDQVILHVGRMVSGERYKGQESLIRAFPLVYTEHSQAQLVLAGQGDDMSRLKKFAEELPPAMQARIFIPGFVSDELLDQIYQLSYVFAMPSIGEGFGLVYLEAMSRGKACLGGNVDATPYVIRDGVTGLLVDDPRSPEQVAASLNWFLSHPEETSEMGRKGAELVQEYYLFPHFQERFWNAVR